MVASVIRSQSPHNFLLNQILVRKCVICATFSKDLFAVFGMIFPCIQVTRQQYVLSFSLHLLLD
jgi:hypothetical protein